MTDDGSDGVGRAASCTYELLARLNMISMGIHTRFAVAVSGDDSFEIPGVGLASSTVVYHPRLMGKVLRLVIDDENRD